MQHKPGMFADWNDMISTVTIWAAVSFCLIAIPVVLIWALRL